MSKVRPDIHQRYMKMAETVAENSTCPRLNVGAVLVKDGVDLMTGYNGSLPGMDHCVDVGCLMHEGSCKRTVHAEMNILMRAARFGVSLQGTTMYVTHYPCPDCMKHMITAGVKTVFYRHYYPHKYKNEFETMLSPIPVSNE